MEKRDAADPALPGLRDGWQLVPTEPTAEMLTDDGVDIGERTAGRVWSAMLTVAPAPPADDRLADLDASWRATLVKERTIHLNEVRLKDEFRTRALVAESDLARVTAQRDDLAVKINSPETENWMAGVPLEAAHQIERWGAGHDAGKRPLDWFWLIGYLAQKAATSTIAGDMDKAKHHVISTAAALLNWHRQLSGKTDGMRPGIDPAERRLESAE